MPAFTFTIMRSERAEVTVEADSHDGALDLIWDNINSGLYAVEGFLDWCGDYDVRDGFPDWCGYDVRAR